MKYLKLFEAFESSKLSKTLGFLKSGKENFMEELKSLAQKSDFPFSEYSDEMFQYLPFKKAFNFFWKPEPTTCETCKGQGRYRRPWGRGTREVECKECEGTGKITPKAGKISHIKFWFNSEGKYLGKTAIDGTVTEKQSIVIAGEKYVIDSTINPSKLKTLDHETKVRMVIYSRWVDGVIWKSGNVTWFIQNWYSNSSMGGPRGSAWKKWGAYGWNLNDYTIDNASSFPKLLRERGKEMDPFEFNYEVRTNYQGNMSLYKNQDIKYIINDAEFALILDLSKIKSEKKVSDIKSKRKETKSGILTPEQIKNQNISRYFDKLSQDFEISEDLGRISRIAPKIFGWSNCIPYIMGGINFGNFEHIINLYFDFMKGEKAEYKIQNLNHSIRRSFRESLSYIKERNNNITENIQKIRQESQKNNNELAVEFLDSLVSLGKDVNDKILSQKAENLSDLELILQRVTSMSNILNSERYMLSNFRYFITRLGTSSWQVLLEELRYKSVESIKRAIEDIKTIKGIIDRI